MFAREQELACLLLIIPRPTADKEESDKDSHSVPERLFPAAVHSRALSPLAISWGVPTCFSLLQSAESPDSSLSEPGGQKATGVLSQGPVRCVAGHQLSGR